MNVIYSIIFRGIILKQKAQNVRIAPTNQIFHTFTDKKKLFWNSHQVLVHLTFGRFCFSDIKSNIIPEAISFNFAEQEESVESPQDKTVFQHHLFQT